MNKEEQYKKILQHLFEDILTFKNTNLVDSTFAKDINLYTAHGVISGIDDLKKLLLERNQAFTNPKYDINDIIFDGSKVIVRWSGSGKGLKGKAEGDFGGFQVGKETTYWGLSIFEFENDLISKNWYLSSIDDLPRSLGSERTLGN